MVFGLAAGLLACSDDDDTSATVVSDPSDPPPSESRVYPLRDIPGVIVYWKPDEISVTVLEELDDDDPTTMRCDGVSGERIAEIGFVSVDLPDRSPDLDVNCSLSTGETFVVRVPGLVRDDSGEFVRSAESEAIIEQCALASGDGDVIDEVWAQGTVDFNCPIGVGQFESDPSEFFRLSQLLMRA